MDKKTIEKIFELGADALYENINPNTGNVNAEKFNELKEKAVKLFTIPVVLNCSTCKHFKLKNWQEPCLYCNVNKYSNYESAIVL